MGFACVLAIEVKEGKCSHPLEFSYILLMCPNLHYVIGQQIGICNNFKCKLNFLGRSILNPKYAFIFLQTRAASNLPENKKKLVCISIWKNNSVRILLQGMQSTGQ